MKNKGETGETSVTAGLCANCVHAREVTSNRGATFLLCELSRRDPGYAKYPRLPVLSCLGYAPNARPGAAESGQ